MRIKSWKALLASPLLAATLLPAQSLGGVQAVPAVWTPAQSSAHVMQVSSSTTTRRHRRVRRRSKKKSALIIGGSGLAGAGIGALAGGKKGAIIGGAAGAGAGYVYDRKSQKKPIIPK